MNTKELEVICELTKYDNFFDAAYSLSYTPSVITKYVSNIENELGVKLFNRSNKSSKLSLTEEGKVLINTLRRLNSDYHFLLEQSRQLRDSETSIIRIGSQPRYGNLHEQEIIASFLHTSTHADIHMVKAVASDLIGLLRFGSLDAIFVTIHGEIDAREYLRSRFEEFFGDIEYLHILSERDIYCGVDEKYFPGRSEVNFRELKDFTFAFPFINSGEFQEQKAASSYTRLAEKNGFELKTLHIAGYDSTVFTLATKRPIAVCTTNAPAQYKGIRFVRIADWEGSTNLYFVCLKSNPRGTLKALKKSVRSYIGESEASRQKRK